MALSDAIEQQFVNPCTNGELEGIFMRLHHDATPFLVRFGRLQPFVQETARYLLKIAQKWKCVSYADFLELSGTRPRGDLGVLEFLSLQFELSWKSCSEVRGVFLSPRVVQRGNASNPYSAINDALGPIFQ